MILNVIEKLKNKNNKNIVFSKESFKKIIQQSRPNLHA